MFRNKTNSHFSRYEHALSDLLCNVSCTGACLQDCCMCLQTALGPQGHVVSTVG